MAGIHRKNWLHLLSLETKNPFMSKLEAGSTLQRLRNRYRLVVMNDDTYEEVVTFKLSRLSVYVMLSTIFVVLVGLTVALIVFTPLKYYIPGTSNDYKSVMELKRLQYRVDSVERQDAYKTQYILGLKKPWAARKPPNWIPRPSWCPNRTFLMTNDKTNVQQQKQNRHATTSIQW